MDFFKLVKTCYVKLQHFHDFDLFLKNYWILDANRIINAWILIAPVVAHTVTRVVMHKMILSK